MKFRLCYNSIMNTILEYLNNVLGEHKSLKGILIGFAVLALLSLIFLQLLPFLIFLLLAVIVYLQLPKDK